MMMIVSVIFSLIDTGTITCYICLTDTSGVVGRFGDASKKGKGKSKETGPYIHSVGRLGDASNKTCIK